MAETPTGNIKVIKPFRWWKTWAIYLIPCGIIGLIISAPSGRMASYQLGWFIGASATVAALIALLACTAQMWAMVAYYQSGGQVATYYSRLYGVTAVLFATAVTPFLIIILLPWAFVYYFSRRGLVLNKIRELEGIPPIPPRPPGKVDYTWPIVGLAGAIVVAGALIYTSSVNLRRPVIRDDSHVSPSRVASATSDFDPNRAIPLEEYLRSLGMEEFTSEEYGFSVMLKDRPLPVKTEIGTAFNSEVNNFGFSIIVTTIPKSDPNYGNAMAAKANFIKGLAKAQNISNIVASKKVTESNGHEGIEFTCTLQNNGLEYREKGRFFMVNNRVYTVGVAASKDQWNGEFANTLLLTFRIK
jgi:hypothetical protein